MNISNFVDPWSSNHGEDQKQFVSPVKRRNKNIMLASPVPQLPGKEQNTLYGKQQQQWQQQQSTSSFTNQEPNYPKSAISKQQIVLIEEPKQVDNDSMSAFILDLHSSIKRLKRRLKKCRQEKNEALAGKEKALKELTRIQKYSLVNNSSNNNYNETNRTLGDLRKQLELANIKLEAGDIVRKELQDALETEQHKWKAKLQEKDDIIDQLELQTEILTKKWAQEIRELQTQLQNQREQQQKQHAAQEQQKTNKGFDEIVRLKFENEQLHQLLKEYEEQRDQQATVEGFTKYDHSNTERIWKKPTVSATKKDRDHRKNIIELGRNQGNDDKQYQSDQRLIRHLKREEHGKEFTRIKTIDMDLPQVNEGAGADLTRQNQRSRVPPMAAFNHKFKIEYNLKPQLDGTKCKASTSSTTSTGNRDALLSSNESILQQDFELRPRERAEHLGQTLQSDLAIHVKRIEEELMKTKQSIKETKEKMRLFRERIKNAHLR